MLDLLVACGVGEGNSGEGDLATLRLLTQLLQQEESAKKDKHLTEMCRAPCLTEVPPAATAAATSTDVPASPTGSVALPQSSVLSFMISRCGENPDAFPTLQFVSKFLNDTEGAHVQKGNRRTPKVCVFTSREATTGTHERAGGPVEGPGEMCTRSASPLPSALENVPIDKDHSNRQSKVEETITCSAGPVRRGFSPCSAVNRSTESIEKFASPIPQRSWRSSPERSHSMNGRKSPISDLDVSTISPKPQAVKVPSVNRTRTSYRQRHALRILSNDLDAARKSRYCARLLEAARKARIIATTFMEASAQCYQDPLLLSGSRPTSPSAYM
ncbi:hypothetical protein, conserved in T. vivax, partial [Trypanosoma vivax Y486]